MCGGSPRKEAAGPPLETVPMLQLRSRKGPGVPAAFSSSRPGRNRTRRDFRRGPAGARLYSEEASPSMAKKSEATGTSVGASIGSKKKRIRKIFGDIHEVVQMPNLIEVQRESYEQFLRSDKSTGYVSGLEKTLRSVFPIRDF